MRETIKVGSTVRFQVPRAHFFPPLTVPAAEMHTRADAEVRCKPLHVPNPNPAMWTL